MKTTTPVITCDDEDGCTEWAVDWYELTADNWRDLMHGWTYNPHRDSEPHLCPSHTEQSAGSSS